MKYYSCTKIARQLTETLFEEVTTNDVKEALRKLGYLDQWNRTTDEAFGLYKNIVLEFCGRDYIAWREDVIEDIHYQIIEMR